MAVQSQKGLKAIAHDLMTIEVNTIVKAGITARKMPPVPIALLEIIGKYYWFLKDLNDTRNVEGVEEHLSRLKPETRTNSVDSFHALREASLLLMDALRVPYTDHIEEGTRSRNAIVLERIYRNTSLLPKIVEQLESENLPAEMWHATRTELIEMMDAASEINISPNHLVLIQKAWEVGVETVALQSSLQLDGDVVTRVQEAFADSKYQELHRLHIKATEQAVQTWETMARLVSQMVSGVLKAFANIIFQK